MRDEPRRLAKTLVVGVHVVDVMFLILTRGHNPAHAHETHLNKSAVEEKANRENKKTNQGKANIHQQAKIE